MKPSRLTCHSRRGGALALAAVIVCASPLPGIRAAAYNPPQSQQSAVAKLVADLQAIRAGSEITQAQRDALAADLQLLVTSTTRPSEESVAQFTEDLAAAHADGSLGAAERARLAADLTAILNSAGLSTAQAQQLIADVQAVLVASNVDAADVQLIVSDLAAIAASVQANFIVANTTFPLVPATTTAMPAPGGVAASGRAQLISTVANDGAETASLTLSALGLTTGAYTVEVTTTTTAATTSAPVVLGTLNVVGVPGRPGAGAATFGGASGGPLPGGLNLADVATVTVRDAVGGAAQLGGRTADATKATRLGNFRVVPGPAAPAALGNVAFKVTTKNSVTQNRFLAYAYKLPASAALTLKANGVAAGTVMTDAKGRLLIHSGKVTFPVRADGLMPRSTPMLLPAGVNLGTLESLELQNAQGQTVATAGF